MDLLVQAFGTPPHHVISDADRSQPCSFRGGRVAWVGPDTEIPKSLGDVAELDVEGRVTLPGFVDAHTHLVWAGARRESSSRDWRA